MHSQAEPVERVRIGVCWERVKCSEWNFKLKAVYTIGILDFVFDEDKSDKDVFHHEVKMVDIKTQKIFYHKLTYIYLEMPKFDKSVEELDTHFEKWLFVLKNLHKLTNRPVKLQEKIFSQLFEQAEIAQFDDKEYEAYEESLKEYRDLKNSLDTAFDDGEYSKALKIAKKLKNLNTPIDVIIEATDLMRDEIEDL